MGLLPPWPPRAPWAVVGAMAVYLTWTQEGEQRSAPQQLQRLCFSRKSTRLLNSAIILSWYVCVRWGAIKTSSRLPLLPSSPSTYLDRRNATKNLSPMSTAPQCLLHPPPSSVATHHGLVNKREPRAAVCPIPPTQGPAYSWCSEHSRCSTNNRCSSNTYTGLGKTTLQMISFGESVNFINIKSWSFIAGSVLIHQVGPG